MATNPKDLVGAKKAPLALVPPALIIGVSEAMADGAAKYGPFNWRENAVEIMTYLEASLRHIYAFMDGEDNATDSGIHHLKHAGACMGIVLDSIELGVAIDNRPPKGPAAKMLQALDKTRIYVNEVPELPDNNKPVRLPEGQFGRAQARHQVP